ncbi:MAG: hypothetical protein C0501_13980 [Isosphaera sp.]|nr:hypothetical protein [Isosphaera sp.]
MPTDRRAALAAAALLLAAGCQREPELVPVAGRLTVGGEPLTAARVQFVPDRQKGNALGREARARADADGAYALATDGRPGALPGWYQVAVFAFEEVPDGGGPRPPVWLAPARYADPEKSGFAVEVTADAPPGRYDFDLKP